MTIFEKNIVLFLLLAFIQLVDIIITSLALLTGGIELNIFFNILHFGIIDIAFLKFGLLVVIFLLLLKLKNNKKVTILLLIANIWYVIGLSVAVLGFIQ